MAQLSLEILEDRCLPATGLFACLADPTEVRTDPPCESTPEADTVEMVQRGSGPSVVGIQVVWLGESRPTESR